MQVPIPSRSRAKSVHAFSKISAVILLILLASALVIQGCSTGTPTAIQNALYYAADNGADIASMSFGASISSDPATDAAIQYAYNAGVTMLAATGNENAGTISYPAIHQDVIGVGAASPCGDRKRSSSSGAEVNPGVNTDPNGYTCDGERWWGSNCGTNTADARGAVDVIAPTILPTTDIAGGGGYQSGDYEPFFNGTSCATPYAAGVCALIKSANPGWTSAQVRDQLVNTAIDIVNVESGAGWDRYSGYGMVDAAAAVGGGGPANQPPTANANGPYSGNTGVALSFSSAGSSDPDGSIVSYSWDFGDGATSTQANPSHSYGSAGTYTISLTVTDDMGADRCDRYRRHLGQHHRPPDQQPARGGLHGHPDVGERAAGGELHRQLDEQPHVLELDLRGRWHLDGPESLAHLCQRRHLHRIADCNERLRVGHHDPQRIHHREHGTAVGRGVHPVEEPRFLDGRSLVHDERDDVHEGLDRPGRLHQHAQGDLGAERSNGSEGPKEPHQQR